MKIGIITDFIDNGFGGIGTYGLNLISTLNVIDHSNTYYLIHSDSKNLKIYENNEELFIRRLSIPKGSTFFWRYFTVPFKLKYTHELDLIHDLYAIGPLSFKLNCKKIVTVHDLTPVLFPHTFNFSNVLIHKMLLSRTLKNADKIITDSESTKKDLTHYFHIPNNKIEVIYCGVDQKKFRTLDKNSIYNFLQGYNINYPFILYVGTLEPRKNIPTLIKAYSQLKKRTNLNHKLVIAGKKGWKYQEIFEVIDELKLSKDVIFTGYVPDNDLPALYNAADLFVYPSIYEGFGLPPLEAMACGTPVITSNTSSLPEVVGDAGIMFDPSDINALLSAMYEVLTNNSLKQEMIKKGLNRAELFSWESCAVKILKLYNEI